MANVLMETVGFVSSNETLGAVAIRTFEAKRFSPAVFAQFVAHKTGGRKHSRLTFGTYSMRIDEMASVAAIVSFVK